MKIRKETSMKMRNNPMNYPNDVTYEILSRIPAESAIQCKRVSTTWRNYLDHVKEGMIFAIGLNNEEKTSFRLYYAENDMIRNNVKKRCTYGNLIADFHHPPIENRYRRSRHANHKDVIVGSCNGIVCFTIPNGVLDDPVYICNPFTRQSVNLPRLAVSLTSQKGLVVSGFGFDLHSEQYKVVRIYYPDGNLDVGCVEVYTLGAGSGWRNIGVVTYSLCSSQGILVDGMLHWIDYNAMQIVGFGLKDEKFVLVPSPPCLHLGDASTNYRLKKLRGCLCVVHHMQEHKCVYIWFYAKDYSASCSYNVDIDRHWSLEIKMNYTSTGCTGFMDDYDPFLVTEKNIVLYWVNKSNLFCFDPATSSKRLVIRDSSYLGWKYFNATPHVNTRVSLETLEKENCVVQEWDGCEEELDEPLGITEQVLQVPDDNVLPWKIAVPLGIPLFIWNFVIIFSMICIFLAK